MTDIVFSVNCAKKLGSLYFLLEHRSSLQYIQESDKWPHLAGLANAWKAVDRAGGHDYLEAVFTDILEQAEMSGSR